MRLDLPRERDFEAGVWYSTRASTWYPAHYHDELELKLVLWGSTVYQIGEEEVLLGPGSLLWLAPGQEHALRTASADLAMWVASFRIPTVRAAEKAAGVQLLGRAQAWGVCVLPPTYITELSLAYFALANCEEPALANLRSLRLLTRALALATHRASARSARAIVDCTSRGSLHVAVSRARELLCDMQGDVRLASLARLCGLDGPRLSRVFKQQMGLSMVKFRNHFRIQQFIARLGRGEGHNMLRVALDSGFGSYPQFHRAFRQVTGYAPSEHVHRVRAGIVFPTHQYSEALPRLEQGG